MSPIEISVEGKVTQTIVAGQESLPRDKDGDLVRLSGKESGGAWKKLGTISWQTLAPGQTLELANGKVAKGV